MCRFLKPKDSAPSSSEPGSSAPVAQPGADQRSVSPALTDFLQQAVEQEDEASTLQLSQHRQVSQHGHATGQQAHDCSTAIASSRQQEQHEASCDSHAKQPTGTESNLGTTASAGDSIPETQASTPLQPSHSAQPPADAHSVHALSAAEAQPDSRAPSSTCTTDLSWDLDTGGGQVDEDVLNALPPELKHEVRLAIMSRMGRRQRGSQDGDGATVLAQPKGHAEGREGFVNGIAERGLRPTKLQASADQHAGMGKGQPRSKRSAAPISHFFQKQKR